MGRPPVVVFLAGVVVLVILVRGVFVGPEAAEPPRVPLKDVQPWMVDALPGIGPQRREGAVRKVLINDLSSLPSQSRPLLPEVFTCVPPAR